MSSADIKRDMTSETIEFIFFSFRDIELAILKSNHFTRGR